MGTECPRVKIIYDDETERKLKRIREIEDIFYSEAESMNYNNYLDNNFRRDSMDANMFNHARSIVMQHARIVGIYVGPKKFSI